jgi:Nucleoside recognition.
MDVIGIIMSAGKSSVDVALYTLLPIMVVMLIIMKYLEVRGILDVIVRWLAPLLKPFGLTGMSAFALIQINFVSFAPRSPLSRSWISAASPTDKWPPPWQWFSPWVRATLLSLNAVRPALAGRDRHFNHRRTVRRGGLLVRHRA